ncbi:hypothetical protein PQ455_07300 [Sphingomonas naphthae]|uniref:Uncharacterized protein n=1 Tax=Sphingomonas naphthae TaxID=1813468 RepID=A0ABY7TS13_9SPHN|nr:hypothetical protein [Sphingomonas naphthae]WCT75014.1 hypothetical protein PQ455_07300 [Sphingomonas naphthae]
MNDRLTDLEARLSEVGALLKVLDEKAYQIANAGDGWTLEAVRIRGDSLHDITMLAIRLHSEATREMRSVANLAIGMGGTRG